MKILLLASALLLAGSLSAQIYKADVPKNITTPNLVETQIEP